MADGEEGNASAHKGSSRRRGAAQVALDADELLTLMHGSDPVKVELHRLENEVRGELFIPASHSQPSYGILLCIWWIFAALFSSLRAQCVALFPWFQIRIGSWARRRWR
jgi:hypothetical protein